MLAGGLGRTNYGLALRISDRALTRCLVAGATAAVETLAEAVAMIVQEPIQPTDTRSDRNITKMFLTIIVHDRRQFVSC